MKTFVQQLKADSKSIHETRVLNACRSASAISRGKIEEFKTSLMKLENDFESLTDLNPDSTFDLNRQLKTFDAESYISKLHEICCNIYNTAQKIQIAINIHKAQFPDDKIEELTQYDKDLIYSIAGDLWNIGGKVSNEK